jgi:hypothetical protein
MPIVRLDSAEAGFLVRVHPEPCLILSRAKIHALHCNNSYLVFVMVPSCLHTYQLQFGFLTEYYIGFLSV